jgi:hypothetical protein
MKSNSPNKLLVLTLGAVAVLGVACGGGLGKNVRSDVTSTMQAAEPDLERCYAAALERDSNTKARIVLDLKIKAKSGAFEPKVASNSSTDAELESCVVSVVSQLKLQKAQKAHIATSYPLEFEPR